MKRIVRVAGTAVCILVFLSSLAYAFKEPFKSLVRQRVIERIVTDIETAQGNIEYQVPATDCLAVNGEEDLDIDLSSFGQSDTLHLAGLLEIPSIGVTEPCWIECSRLALRYGVCIWPDSAMPGEAGNCTILGHRNRHISTIFCHLQEIETGAKVYFTLPSGEKLEYEVSRTLNVAPKDIERLIEKSASKESQLTIITCATELGAGYRFAAVCRLIRD